MNGAFTRTVTLATLALGIGLCCLANVAQAQLAKGKNMGIGLGAAVAQTPEESKFSSTGTAADLFFDWDITDTWLKFRVGYNAGAEGKYKFDLYNKTWDNDLKTDSVYVAWRYGMSFMGDALQAYALIGAASMSSTLKIDPGAASASDSGVGVTAGAGALYSLGSFGLGAQYQLFSRQGKLGGATLATGSNQFQIVANYSF